MNTEENTKSVVVTDIKMPLWSMVVFMVKWAIAAIPALILLAIIAFLLSLAFGGIVSGLSRNTVLNSIPERSVPSTATKPKAAEYTGPVADRCKGSYESEKCMEAERKFMQETPEQRSQRQLDLERQRRENLQKVGK